MIISSENILQDISFNYKKEKNLHILFNIYFIIRELPLELSGWATWTLNIKKALDSHLRCTAEGSSDMQILHYCFPVSEYYFSKIVHKYFLLLLLFTEM